MTTQPKQNIIWIDYAARWAEYKRDMARWKHNLEHEDCIECGVKLQVVDNLESKLCRACENKGVV